MRAQGIVRRDGRGHQIGPLRRDALVHMLAAVTVRPKVDPSVKTVFQLI